MNHITRSASMYYLRTILTFFVSFISIAMNVPFPFIPFQITLTNMFVDGFPSFMLLFEQNIEKPKESLFAHVFRHSVPNAFAIIFFWLVLNMFNSQLNLTVNTSQTMMYFLNGYISIHMIYRIYKPLNTYRLGRRTRRLTALPPRRWDFPENPGSHGRLRQQSQPLITPSQLVSHGEHVPAGQLNAPKDRARSQSWATSSSLLTSINNCSRSAPGLAGSIPCASR